MKPGRDREPMCRHNPTNAVVLPNRITKRQRTAQCISRKVENLDSLKVTDPLRDLACSSSRNRETMYQTLDFYLAKHMLHHLQKWSQSPSEPWPFKWIHRFETRQCGDWRRRVFSQNESQLSRRSCAESQQFGIPRARFPIQAPKACPPYR